MRKLLAVLLAVVLVTCGGTEAALALTTDDVTVSFTVGQPLILTASPDTIDLGLVKEYDEVSWDITLNVQSPDYSYDIWVDLSDFRGETDSSYRVPYNLVTFSYSKDGQNYTVATSDMVNNGAPFYSNEPPAASQNYYLHFWFQVPVGLSPQKYTGTVTVAAMAL